MALQLKRWLRVREPYWKSWAELPGRLRFCQALRDYHIRGRVECHADVRTWNLHVLIRIHRHAIAPIHDAVLLGVDRGLHHRTGNFAAEIVQEVASATSGVAVRQDSRAVFL